MELLDAADEGDEEKVSLLLRSGDMDVNVRDLRDRERWTALHWACRGGNHRVVSLLLQAGALVEAVDSMGYTALHYAGMFGRTECAQVLLEEGKANLEAQAKLCEGTTTPLRLAALYSHWDTVRLFLRWNAMVSDVLIVSTVREHCSEFVPSIVRELIVHAGSVNLFELRTSLSSLTTNHVGKRLLQLPLQTVYCLYSILLFPVIAPKSPFLLLAQHETHLIRIIANMLLL